MFLEIAVGKLQKGFRCTVLQSRILGCLASGHSVKISREVVQLLVKPGLVSLLSCGWCPHGSWTELSRLSSLLAVQKLLG